MEEMSAKSDQLVASGGKDKNQFEYRRQARRLIFDMSLLESRMKRDAFDKHFLDLKENYASSGRQVVELVKGLSADTTKSKN